jgi:hypothetical protein
VNLALSLPVAVASATALTGLDPLDATARRAQQRMSRAAFLAQAALSHLLHDTPWAEADRAEVGFFLGVGASGGSVAQFERIMAVSVTDGDHGGPSGHGGVAWSQRLFNTAGLKACNPLYAFQLMNNFTLCHAAIAAGLGGPNAALHSTGAGTWGALLEAVAAIEEGACLRAVVGGADDPTHPVTRLTPCAAGLVPTEAAALLALSAMSALPVGGPPPLALLTHLSATPAADASPLPDPTLSDPTLSDPALPLTQTLTWCADPSRRVHAPPHLIDLSSDLGDALAATPALLWVRAVNALSATIHTVHARWSDLTGFTHAATFTCA